MPFFIIALTCVRFSIGNECHIQHNKMNITRISRNESGRLLDSEGALSDTTILILPPDSSDLPTGTIFPIELEVYTLSMSKAGSYPQIDNVDFFY